jgi:hypothetical protein
MRRSARREALLTDGLIGVAILAAITCATLLLKNAVATDRLLQAIGLVVGISICTTFVATLTVGRLFHSAETAQALTVQVQGLVNSIEGLEHIRALAVPDSTIAEYESKASVIRVITPDLFSDTRGLYDTILNNVRQGKEYRYVIPESTALLEQMRILKGRLRRELGKGADEFIALRYRASPLAPITTEYVLYEFEPNIGPTELMGFVEIKLGRETTNLRLDRRTALELSCWIDDMVCPSTDAKASAN